MNQKKTRFRKLLLLPLLIAVLLFPTQALAVYSCTVQLPVEVKTAHYHDDETHIRALLEAGGLQPKGGMALAAATVRGLILTVSHQEQIGALYPQVLETLVRGACLELFA